MERFRFGGGGEGESIGNMANLLMLLSRGGVEGTDQLAGASPGRVFECKTCNRQFPSFQALGGHRASHKKPRVDVADGQLQGGLAKPRVHECSICGLEFAIGQALGGHMRRHRPVARWAGHGLMEEKGEVGRMASLDLNLPPSEINDNESREIVLELRL